MQRYIQDKESSNMPPQKKVFPIQVLDVRKHGDTCFEISVMCCFCGKKHFHGAGVVNGVLPSPSDMESSISLGYRVPHCSKKGDVRMHMGNQYELMLDAWYACGKKVKPPLRK
jgi:hypothetical protein